MGRAADADKRFREALALAPDYPDVYGRYGRFCHDHGRYDEAIKLFRKQTEILPEAPRGYSNLGSSLQAAGRYEEALRAYNRSIAIKPTGGAYSNLGVCQYSLGHYADAAAAFQKAADLIPKNYVIWANLGDAYRWTPGQRSRSNEAYGHAIALARDAIAVNANDAQARAIAASSLAKRGDFGAADTEMKLALKSDPTNSSALYQAAVIANIRGDRDGALLWLERAIASGYTRADAARDPEFTNLRRQPAFLKATRPNA
jgi:serine/threonine-protein kinase